MTSFSAPIFFVFHFCVLICLSTAGWLPTDPYKMLEKCYQLTQLPEFKEMIRKFGDQPIPIQKGKEDDAVWDEEGKVNYPKLLVAIKSHISIFNKLLTDSLECAGRVHEYALKEMPKSKGNKQGYKKLPKKEWINLDENFEAEFQKIWMIKEPDTLRTYECGKIIKSPRLRKMIGILQDEVPIVKRDNYAVWDGEGPVNYPNLLTATDRFLKETPLTHFLIKPIFTDINERLYVDTVKELLNKTLQCAVAVHQHTQQILVVKKGSNKETRNAEIYTNLDEKFKTELKKIWGLKPEKLI